MEDGLQPYRQPIVTATGIILGFVLNFASSWVKSDSPTAQELGYAVGVFVIIGVSCLLVTLYRILQIGIPGAEVKRYYSRTLQVFLAGVGMSLLGAVIDMISNYFAV